MIAAPLPPGPAEQSAAESQRQFLSDPLSFLIRCAQTYGDVVRIGPQNYLLYHPDAIEYVLVNTNRRFGKFAPGTIEPSGPGRFSSGMVNNEGAVWAQHRQLLKPAFHRERIVAWGDRIVRQTQQALETWRVGDIRQVYPDMLRLALATTAQFICNPQTSAEAADLAAMTEALLQANQHTVRRPLAVPTPANLHLRWVLLKLDRAIYRLIERRAGGPLQHDPLSLLVAAHKASPTELPRQRIRDELGATLMAGYEAVASALAWTLVLLGQHADVQAQMGEEIARQAGDRPLQSDDLPNLPGNEAVIKEVLRLYPPVWITSRETQTEDVLDGYTIPAGTTVGLSPWVTHRDPRFFEQPDRFDPQRWLRPPAAPLPKYAYFPFGGGPRFCLGNTFAMMQVTLIVGTIVRRWRLRVLDPQTITARPAVNLYPVGARVLLS